MTPPLIYNGKCIITEKTCKDSGVLTPGSCRTCHIYQNFFNSVLKEEDIKPSALEDSASD